jgi:hypothetical protein
MYYGLGAQPRNLTLGGGRERRRLIGIGGLEEGWRYVAVRGRVQVVELASFQVTCEAHMSSNWTDFSKLESLDSKLLIGAVRLLT